MARSPLCFLLTTLLSFSFWLVALTDLRITREGDRTDKTNPFLRNTRFDYSLTRRSGDGDSGGSKDSADKHPCFTLQGLLAGISGRIRQQKQVKVCEDEPEVPSKELKILTL